MKLISRKKTGATPLKDATAKMIADFIISRQLAVAKVLKQFERRCSLRQKKLLFLLFCAAGATWLICIMAGALTGSDPDKPARSITVTGQGPPAIPPPIPPPAKDSLTRQGRKY